MIPTAAFLGAGGAAAILAYLAIRSLPTQAAAGRLALAVWAVTFALAGFAFLSAAARMLQAVPPDAPPDWLRVVLLYRAFVPLGVGLACAALLASAARGRPPVRAFLHAPGVRGALRASIALAFLGVEVGKLTHKTEMRAFFASSGLPPWMNQAVIAAELVLVVALYVHRAETAAAVGLALVMAGAIAVHAHDGDPFTDSQEALHLLLLLICLLRLVLAVRAAEREPAARAPGPARPDAEPSDSV